MSPVIIGNATLYLGDCLDVLPTLGPVDAVISDPPYGIGWKPRVNHQDQTWVDVIDFDIRALLVGRYHLFWGGQYFADQLPACGGWLTWCKRPVEYDFADDGRSYSTTELAWRDWGKSKFMCHVWDGGMRAGVAENRTFCHPSQKPVELMSWCLRQLPADARTVLDPFMGSGTTGVACALAGLSFIGIERDPAYFETACSRIRDAQRQGSMFPPDAPAQMKQEALL